MKYQYTKYKDRLLPIVPIEFRKNEEWIEFRVYVDSGASCSIFHSDTADVLGIGLKKGKKGYIIVGDGTQIPVYYHNLDVRFATKEFRATIGFSEKLGIGFDIIGQKDIFDRFRVCFSNNEKIVEFYPERF